MSMAPALDQDYRLPTSHGQERLWFLDRLNPATAVYNMPIFIRLSQRMKLSVLKRCLVALTERHETLRTAFHRQEGILTQCVSCACAPSLTFVDLRRFHPREREERLSR